MNAMPDAMPDASSTSVHLDHVGFIVADLPASARMAEQLGFTLTSRADHTRTDEHGRTMPAGSAQHSIMLHSGYIELMQITDPTAGHQLASAPLVRHGLHVVAFGTSDAPACHAHRLHAGVPAGPVLVWSRPVQEPDLQGLAQFAYFGSDWSAQDPSYLCWVEHRTPQLLRNPRLLDHANGARALDAMVYAGPSGAARQWVDQLVAAGAMLRASEAGVWELELPNAGIKVLVNDQLPSVLPVALEISGVDTHWLRARCDAIGVRHQLCADGALDVDLLDALGLHCIFRP